MPLDVLQKGLMLAMQIKIRKTILVHYAVAPSLIKQFYHMTLVMPTQDQKPKEENPNSLPTNTLITQHQLLNLFY